MSYQESGSGLKTQVRIQTNSSRSKKCYNWVWETIAKRNRQATLKHILGYISSEERNYPDILSVTVCIKAGSIQRKTSFASKYLGLRIAPCCSSVEIIYILVPCTGAEFSSLMSIVFTWSSLTIWLEQITHNEPDYTREWHPHKGAGTMVSVLIIWNSHTILQIFTYTTMNAEIYRGDFF